MELLIHGNMANLWDQNPGINVFDHKHSCLSIICCLLVIWTGISLINRPSNTFFLSVPFKTLQVMFKAKKGFGMTCETSCTKNEI